MGSKKKAVVLKDQTHEWFELSDEGSPYPPDMAERPPFPDDTYTDPNARIFMGISSLHDGRCGRTLYSLFKKAKNPSRVFVGVVQQNLKGVTRDCVDGGWVLRHGTKIPDKEK